jgi:hypothetical protein
MICWATKEALGTSNEQRVKVLLVLDDDTLVVELCGNGEVKKIPTDAVTKIEVKGVGDAVATYSVDPKGYIAVNK